MKVAWKMMELVEGYRMVGGNLEKWWGGGWKHGLVGG